MEIGATIFVMVLCLAAEAFFSGSEIGVVSADRLRLRHMAAKGSRGAKLALSILEKPEWLLSTTLVGTNIAVVTNTTVVTALVIDLLGEKFSWLAVVIVAPLIWIFGEIVAKSIFQQRADTITPRVIFGLRAASLVFYPILAVFAGLTRLLTGTRKNGEAQNPFTLREEITSMMEMSAQDGDILAVEQTMIRRVFEFSETAAGDIMVPLIDVVAIENTATCGEAMRLAVAKKHKRLLVYEERVDEIIGILNALDLLQEDKDAPIKPHVHAVRYIPTSKGVADLLLEFRTGGDSMAVVVDEFGGAEGIVTIEDILEEVVGEIADEFDESEEIVQRIRRVGKDHYLVSARAELDTLKEEIGLVLPEGDYETLGGFLLTIAADIPSSGQVIAYRGIKFTIERASERAIQEVRVRW